MIQSFLGNITVDQTDPYYAYLQDLEYKIIERMIDDEEARQKGRERQMFTPRQYIMDEERETLLRIASNYNNYAFGAVVL